MTEQRPKTDHVPGVVISHIPASTRCYVGSPSLVTLPDGTYVMSHDVFGKGSSYNTTRVFISADGGSTWSQLTELVGQFWSNLFLHRGELYIMGTSGRFGSTTIRRSTDGGRTWTAPDTQKTGLLFDDGDYHTAPVPVVERGGRLYRAMEDRHPGEHWGRDFRAFMLSASVDSDLLDASSWTDTTRLSGNPDWLDGAFGGWLEGNAVVAPDGGIVDILRVDFRVGTEKAAIVEVRDDNTAVFDPETGFVEFPGGCKKFSIRRDPENEVYWSLSNYVPPATMGFNRERARNTLALLRSADLREWEVRGIVLQHPDPEFHAFQYVDWQFEGQDLIVASRTAYDDGLGGAHNQHDANFLTFHRIEGFRDFRTETAG